MSWTIGEEQEPTDFWNAYTHWAEVLREASPWRRPHLPSDSDEGQDAARPRNKGEMAATSIFEPIFVRANDANMTASEFFAEVEKDNDLRFEDMEETLNDEMLHRPSGTPVEAVLYVRIGRLRTRPYYELLHVGSPVNIQDGTVIRFQTSLLPSKFFVQSLVALGIVDDGIGFLNRRFMADFSIPSQRSTTTFSRFIAVWQQSLAQHKNPKHVKIGKIWTFADVTKEAIKAESSSEAAVYREINQGLYPYGVTRTVEQAASHGTHILDLAGGDDPDAALSKVPIIAVQLPPDSIDDTSGVRLETHLIQGLRWMIAVARANEIPRLVINASLGIHAGPKDSTKFITQQMAWEIEKAAMPIDNEPGPIVDIVLPYGNEYESRQIADLLPVSGTAARVGLRLQPEDLTPSYVEIRPTADPQNYDHDIAALRISLVTPDGVQLGPVNVRPDTYYDIMNPENEVIGRIYHVGKRPGAANGAQVKSYITLAFAPTAPIPPNEQVAGNEWKITAPSGLWQIELQTVDTLTDRISLQVQRDDSAVGYSRRGRQAYFDDEHAHEPDAGDRDYTELGSESALKHEGTNSAYSTSYSGGVHSVGAALVREGARHGDPEVDPARYASEGATWSGVLPSGGSAISETGFALGGVLASGSISGSAARFAGSSTAAATYSRDLVLKYLQGTRLPEISAPAPRSRLGLRTIVDNPAIRDGKV